MPKKYIPLVAGIAVLVVIVIGVISFLSWANSIDNDGYERQRDVVTQYNTYQTSLSNCLDKSKVGASIAGEEYDRLKDTLTAVVGVRYKDGSPLDGDGGALVSALREAYPTIDNSLWKQVMDTAMGCRDEVAGVNNELQSLAGRFDKWRNTGGIFTKHYRSKYPTDELKVASLNGQLTGQAALDFIVNPLTTDEAADALKTHTMPEQDLFGE